MLREARRRKQQIAAKIGHEEYLYRLNGDPISHQEKIRIRPQGDLDPRRVQAAGVRVGVTGARGARGPSRPPFAVDDDANYGDGGGKGGRGAPLSPVSRGPAAELSNEAGALGGRNGYTPPRGNYISPYGGVGGGAGDHQYPFVSHAQPVVSAFAPVLPAIAPVSDLPAPLPAVYRPKPPLTFHNDRASVPGVPPLSFSPLPEYPAAAQVCHPSGDAGNLWPAATPVHLSPGDNGAGRPRTSPVALPPLILDGGGDGGNGRCLMRSPRPRTSGAASHSGSGGLMIGSSDLSAAEERRREKMAARQRAIELQQENARQMLEQQQRKKAEREREIQEDRLAEERLRREREEVARREQAELDREKREKELKMMGPRAAEALLEQQQRETQQRREEEAAARRNRGRASAAAAAPTVGNGAPKSPASPPPTFANAAPVSLSLQSPESGTVSFPAPTSLSSLVAAPPLPHLVNFKLGDGRCPVPQPSSASYYNSFANPSPQAAPLPIREVQAIHSELRRITHLLEEQQQQQQRRARDTIDFGGNAAPQPWHRIVPQPSTPSGAGTYLTTGQPSPSIGAGGDVPMGNAQLDSAAPHRSFSTGGMLPPPPLATAAPPAATSYNASAPSVGTGPWHGLLSPYTGPSATGTGGGLLNPPYGSAMELTGSTVDNDPELSTEPSQFIGPFRAAVAAAAPPPPIAPTPEVTLVEVESMATTSPPASVPRATVIEPDSAHRGATPPSASTAALAPVVMAGVHSPSRSPESGRLPLACHSSPQATEAQRQVADEGELERRASTPLVEEITI
ncbi:hypothetical protein JIQ42_05333 [Leishmania sp. Namibia]|uniref:hypothetical protein n=1 Tax=Leishmania sp. Namibia TaxID=2802991 RepID=UPI001B5B6C7A|nr:hypothetical protein JIQ42_05333 [Leishmania sp. Namibia]